ncbi:MAG: AI-2E family transporter, partial [Oscillospiraceae bacterium]|nr:AI-2E family transporter [Oscillospiraceae bacterium]
LRKLSRAISIVFALVFAVLIIYAFFAMLLPQLQKSLQGIIDDAPRYYKSFEIWLTNLLEDNPQITEYISIMLNNLRGFVNNWAQTTLASDVQTVITTLTSSVVSVVKGAVNIFIGLCVSIYILWAKETLKAQSKKIVIAIFSRKQADHLLYLGREANKIFSGFLIGKLIDSVIIGVLCYIGMLILRMPYPELIATVIGVTNIIPFFGPIIGSIPCTFLILLVNPLQALYFVIFILVLQQIDGNIIGPRILGTSVGISGIWVLLSITIATSIFGFAGMLLGVPVFAFIYLIISDSLRRKLASRGLSTKTSDYLSVTTVSDLTQGEENHSEEV